MPSLQPVRVAAPQPAERPRLDLSGPKLAGAFGALAAGAEETGGVERYVDALKLKSTLFVETLANGKVRDLRPDEFRALCSWMSTVRRRVGHYLSPQSFTEMRARLAALLDGAERTADADGRIAAFCAAFPDDRDHRWVRDLAAEVLHNVDPERYPLMSRWIWDERTNTGVVREIWHAEDIDRITIEVASRYETYVVLREELGQFLAANGVYRDVLFFVDLLAAQVYAGYISEQGGSYLRADFANAEEPMMHIRRLLGLDGVTRDGRARVKAMDGTAVAVDETKRLN
ncbi:MAG TPA: hypothetical protein VII36_11205 [Usitatibacter sp.]